VAKLKNAKLQVEIIVGKKQAKVAVRCDVKFTEHERNMIKAGQGYDLRCKVWGRDHQGALIDPDNKLFEIGPRQ
jgi:hypothetical protein